MNESVREKNSALELPKKWQQTVFGVCVSFFLLCLAQNYYVCAIRCAATVVNDCVCAI